MNILVIEDTKKLAQNIKDVLELEGYHIDIAYCGKDGIDYVKNNNYNLIILDLMLPDIDGIAICQSFREEGLTTPLLMLTAKIDLNSKIEGLDSGADDYLTKPFLMDELLARIRALLRRDSKNKSALIRLGNNVTIDTKSKSVSRSDKLVSLSPYEYKILEFLSINRGKAQKTLEIYENVWGNEGLDDVCFSDTLKVHIANIRKKLGKNIIITRKGFGYIVE